MNLSQLRNELKRGKVKGVSTLNKEYALFAYNLLSQGYKPFQIQIIIEAKKEGLELKELLNSSLNIGQLKEIKLGLANNLDISFYNDNELNFVNMRKLRECLNFDIEVDKNEIITDLELTSRIVNKATLLIDNYLIENPNLDKKYFLGDEKAKEILNGVSVLDDFIKYYKFNKYQLREIIAGVNQNVNISIYAKIEIPYKVMKKIRMDLMKRSFEREDYFLYDKDSCQFIYNGAKSNYSL
ncbi:MAG: hypothetical protein R3Y64_10510 [Peptostreptococcaceae bacterium]